MNRILTRGAVTLAAVLAVVVVSLAVRFRLDAVGGGLALLALVCLSIPLVGAAIARGEPRNPVGWLLLTAGVAIPLGLAAYLYSHASYDGADLPATRWVAWMDGWPWTPALTVVPTIGLLLFPTGRVTSRRWRWVLWFAIVVNAAQLLNEFFAPHLLDYPKIANPTALPGVAGSIADGLAATIILLLPLVILAAVSVTQRWRTEREALRIVVIAAWIIVLSWVLCGVAVITTGDSNNALAAELMGVAALAIASSIAIQRYGVFDARRVLSRTIAYAGLSVCVLIVYGAAAAVVTVVASGAVRGPVAAVVAVLAALPLRGVLQRAANRLVYGDRDDPLRALDQLGQRLADASAPDDVLPGIAATIRDALRLRYVGIRIDSTEVHAGRPIDDTEEMPLVFAGETIGALILGNAEPFTAAELRLLASLGRQVATAGRAVALTHELQRSRERLVGATEEERRRIRRDLHDGLGPGLAGVVLGLQRARRYVDVDPHVVIAQLDALTAQTKDAIADVRRLVYDLQPPALDELGLVDALSEQARMLGDFTVHGPNPAPPLPAAVEVASYRIAVEAMTNVVRHAHARTATVTIHIDGAVRLEIADDGDGLPEAFRAGVGITSMRERATELGGDLTVEAGEPGGTRVRAMIPLERP